MIEVFVRDREYVLYSEFLKLERLADEMASELEFWQNHPDPDGRAKQKLNDYKKFKEKS